jgi:hypothetical protein
MASACWFSSWDVGLCGGHPNNNQFKKNSFYIAISYKDNDCIPSIDIYNKVNVHMAIYVRRNFSAE